MLLSIELVIALPILLIVILASVEFTFMLLGSQALTAAANVGAVRRLCRAPAPAKSKTPSTWP